MRSSGSSPSSRAQDSPCGVCGETATTSGCNRPGVFPWEPGADPIQVKLRRLLRPAPPLERDPAQHALLVLVGAALALAAALGIAWAAGFHTVYSQLRDVDPIWVAVAFVREVAPSFGYVVAYRELTRPQGGPGLGIGRGGAIVAAGFGVFVI